MKCSNCNSDLREGAVFCAVCGAPVPTEKPPVLGQCQFCDTEILEGELFCTGCGKPADVALPSVEPEPKCATCGAPLKESARFCGACGSSTEAGEAEPDKEEEKPVGKAAVWVAEMPPLDIPPAKPDPEPEPQQEEEVAAPEPVVTPATPQPEYYEEEISVYDDPDDPPQASSPSTYPPYPQPDYPKAAEPVQAPPVPPVEEPPDVSDSSSDASYPGYPVAEEDSEELGLGNLQPFQPDDITEEDILTESDVVLRKKTSPVIPMLIILLILILVFGVIFIFQVLLPGSLFGSGTSSSSSVSPAAQSQPADIVDASTEPSNPSEEPAPELPSEPEGTTPTGQGIVQLSIPVAWEMASSFDGEGFARIQQDGPNTMGLVNRAGEIITTNSYASIAPFSEERARFSNVNLLYGFLDSNGSEAIAATYMDAGDFSEGVAAVNRDGSWGYIGPDGNERLPFQYEYAGAFQDGLAVVRQNGEVFFIDSSGEPQSPIFQDARAFSGGYAAVSKNGKWGYVSTDFAQAVDFQYDGAEDFQNGLAVVRQGTRQFYVNGSGERLSPEVDQLWPLQDGMGTAKVGDLYGFVDGKSQDFVIEPQYIDCYSFSGGYAPVSKNAGIWYYIDHENNPQFNATVYEHAYSFSQGYARVQVEGGFAIINTAGETISPDVWEDAGVYAEGMIPVKRGGLWGYLSVE